MSKASDNKSRVKTCLAIKSYFWVLFTKLRVSINHIKCFIVCNVLKVTACITSIKLRFACLFLESIQTFFLAMVKKVSHNNFLALQMYPHLHITLTHCSLAGQIWAISSMIYYLICHAQYIDAPLSKIGNCSRTSFLPHCNNHSNKS